MKYRVKITQAPKYNVKVKMPEAKTGMQVEGSLYNELASFGGADAKDMVPKTDVRKTITKVPREEANLEAEGGETVLTFDPAGYPLFYDIKGPRHSQNGVPLNLPDDSFIFSDTRSMRITDQEILDMFGLSKKKGGHTPADISKKYLELNKYREILQSPDSDKIAKATADRMIKGMVIKLGALAVAQESKKGFPQGIPSIARPYMDAYGISEEQLIPQQQEEVPEEMMGQGSPMQSGMEQIPPTQAEQEDMMMSPEMMEQTPMAMYGTIMGGYEMPFEYSYGGYLPQAAPGGVSKDRPKTKEELQAELNAGKSKVQKTKKLPDGTIEITRADGSKVYAKGNVGEAEDYSNIKVKKSTNLAKDPKKYEKDICAKIKASKKPIEFAIANGWILASRASEFANCVAEEAVAANRNTSEFYEMEEEPKKSQRCVCEDPTTGEPIYSEPDANGECPPCYGYEKLPGGKELMTNPYIQKRGTVFPEDVAALYSTFGYRTPRKDPMAISPRGTQFEQYGIDPRGLSNSLMASSNAGQRAITQITGSTPAAALAAQYQGQKAAAEGIKGAFDQANKFNTDTRNQEIMTNTQMRQNFLDKDAVYKMDYDQKLAQQAQNKAKTYNEIQADRLSKFQNLRKNERDLKLYNESAKYMAYDPVAQEFYQKEPWELGYDPNAMNSGSDQIASRTQKIMQDFPDISDAIAYKIAQQQSKFGGATMFRDGGFVYTVFPIVDR
jgi:hypothetical protein